MEIRGSHRQSSDTLPVRPARDRIIRRGADTPSTAAERFESSCFSLKPPQGTDNRFCDTALAREQPGSKHCVTTSGYAGDLFTRALRMASTGCWIFECGRIAKVFAQVSGADDPAHHFCVSGLWDIADKKQCRAVAIA